MAEPWIAIEDTGAGPPIVLLHGLTATRRYVVQGSRHLLGRGYRVLAYDARGHGESEAPSDPGAYDYHLMVGDLDRVLTEKGLDRPVLVGSSMGAHTATAFALERPERVAALVQITPAYIGAGRSDPGELTHWDALAGALEQGDVEAFIGLSGTASIPERWREGVELGIRQRLERHRDLRAVAAALRVVPRSDAWAGLERLRGLEVPTLVVASRDEVDPGHPISVAEEYARLIPGAELVVEDPGASPLAWQGSQLSRAIGDFLERALPQGGPTSTDSASPAGPGRASEAG
ncbi:MAG TPA: alpha/beta hydrolase [Thermoleophilaceae bacterium]|nr:alpha/beta hydrolase [Thermoleophilaceae bacterium]